VLRRTGNQPLARVERVHRAGRESLYAIDCSYGGLPEDRWKRVGLYELREWYYRLTEAEIAEYLLVFGAEHEDASWKLASERKDWIQDRRVS